MSLCGSSLTYVSFVVVVTFLLVVVVFVVFETVVNGWVEKTVVVEDGIKDVVVEMLVEEDNNEVVVACSVEVVVVTVVVITMGVTEGTDPVGAFCEVTGDKKVEQINKRMETDTDKMPFHPPRSNGAIKIAAANNSRVDQCIPFPITQIRNKAVNIQRIIPQTVFIVQHPLFL